MKNILVPVIKNGNFSLIKNKNTIDCFIGFDDESKKQEYIELIKDKMSKHRKFNIYHDFKVQTKIENKIWYSVNNVMIYENRSANDSNRLVVGGKEKYEFALWISANKK
jgi:hypothetical protein